MAQKFDTDTRFHWIEQMIENNPYLARLAKIGELNSALLHSIAEGALRFDEIASRAMEKHENSDGEQSKHD
ncbi:MAG: hypothetical protein D6694_14685 [Gammaproteobacteria bacterium]|nr:MAG: hypothetical protein D6694_14685 [Gammaproteobacteria bacterium]